MAQGCREGLCALAILVPCKVNKPIYMSATGADMQHGFVRMGICAFEVVMIYNVLS